MCCSCWTSRPRSCGEWSPPSTTSPRSDKKKKKTCSFSHRLAYVPSQYELLDCIHGSFIGLSVPSKYLTVLCVCLSDCCSLTGFLVESIESDSSLKTVCTFCHLHILVAETVKIVQTVISLLAAVQSINHYTLQKHLWPEVSLLVTRIIRLMNAFFNPSSVFAALLRSFNWLL